MEEQHAGTQLGDFPVEDSFAEAFDNLFSFDDIKVSDEALLLVASAAKFPPIPLEFHSLIEACGLERIEIGP